MRALPCSAAGAFGRNRALHRCGQTCIPAACTGRFGSSNKLTFVHADPPLPRPFFGGRSSDRLDLGGGAALAGLLSPRPRPLGKPLSAAALGRSWSRLETSLRMAVSSCRASSRDQDLATRSEMAAQIFRSAAISSPVVGVRSRAGRRADVGTILGLSCPGP